MYKVIENITSKAAAWLYRHGLVRLANPLARLSWRAYDRCPVGYKGKGER